MSGGIRGIGDARSLALSIARASNRNAFADELEDRVAAAYRAEDPACNVAQFDFSGASYLFDDRPDVDRTLLVIAPPIARVDARDTYLQRGYPLAVSGSGRPMDRGHFVPHSAGGDFGPNIFIQDRALNRGWSPDGRRYRALERAAIASGKDALMFVRPLYIDKTAVPAFLELGYWSQGHVTAELFRNRYDESALGDADRFEAAICGATSAQVGALGEETVGVLLEDHCDAQILAMGDASMPRDGRRQDLDVLALVDGQVIAYEVKTRLVGRTSGVRTRTGNLRRPRLRRSGPGPRQGSELYTDMRANRFIEAGDLAGHPEVRVVVVDLIAMLAQEFHVTAAGRVSAPSRPPIECESAARKAYARIIEYRGSL